MSARSRLTVVAILVAGALPLAGPAHAGDPDPLVDFNGDDHGDLAIGAPREDVNGIADAGAVHVLYGTASGLSSAGDQRWHQGRLAAIDGRKLEAGDRFGTAVAAADFNGDGFTDLAIGVPGEDHDGFAGIDAPEDQDSGVVHVLYGSADGLTTTGALIIRNEASSSSAHARFGAALAPMNKFREIPAPPNVPDAFVDLAIGAPGSATKRGHVKIVSMDADGLGGSGSVVSCPGGGPGDGCGAVLTAGHITKHPFDGLVIGAPQFTVAGKANAGMVVLMLPQLKNDGTYQYGAPQEVTADDIGLFDSQAGARLGAALANADTVGNSVRELFIGVPGQDLDLGDTVIDEAGIALLVVGADAGPSNVVAPITEADDDIANGPAAGDQFGSAITIGGFGTGGAVAIGAPGETVSGKAKAGAVNVYYTSDATPDKMWHLDRPGVLGTAAAGDRFGQVLHRMPLVGSGFDDLVVGVPLAAVGAAADAGAVSILPGGPAGIAVDSDQRWTLDSPSVEGTAAAGDRFGAAAD